MGIIIIFVDISPGSDSVRYYLDLARESSVTAIDSIRCVREYAKLAAVDSFLPLLRKKFPSVPVTLEDERFTSVLAHRAMIDGGMKYKDRRDKNSVDRISAAIILQGYLDRTKV